MSNTNETHNQHTNLHTIKDVMNKLDCSRSTIYNTMTKHDLTFIKKDNVNHIDDEQLTIISNTIMLNKHKQPKQYQTHQDDNVKHDDKQDVKHDDTHNTSDTSDKDTIIEHMNKEIEYLREQLTTSQRLLDQQQQLAIRDTSKIDRLEKEIEQYRLSNTQATYTDNTEPTHNNRSDISDNNNPASHTHSDEHTDDISDDNKNEDVTTVDNKEGANTLSNEHTDDNKNATNTGTYKDNKGAEHKNKIGFFARIFGK